MTEYRGVCARVSLSVWIGLMNVPGTGFKKIVLTVVIIDLSLIHISEPTRQYATSRMPSSA